MFLKISQNLQENTCVRASFSIKMQAWRMKLYQKQRLQRRCFPMNYANFLRTTFYKTSLAAASVTVYVNILNKAYSTMCTNRYYLKSNMHTFIIIKSMLNLDVLLPDVWVVRTSCWKCSTKHRCFSVKPFLESFCKKRFLKNFTKFTRKHLC